MLMVPRRSFFFASAVLILLAVAPLAGVPQDGVRAGKIVIFDPAVLDRNAREIVVRGAGGTDLKALPLVNGVAAALPSAALRVLSRRPGVVRVDDDLTLCATGKPGQPAESIPWGIERVGAPAAWPVSAGQGARVAVLDTGIQLDHPDLAGNIAGGYNAINPTKSPNDGNGHGTHVAGTIAAVDNEIGVVGVAHDAGLYAVRVLNNSGSGRLSDLVDGLDWCINNGIQIVNMSLGSATDNATFHEAILRAYQAGLVQIAAAGNNGGLFGAGTGLVDYPAAYPEVIAVSAVDAVGNFATFSSSGEEVDLAAPGVGVLSTYRHGNYATASGTSMAAPHVTGLAALYISTHPGNTPDEVKLTLQSAAVDLGLPPEQQGAGLAHVPAFETIPAVSARAGFSPDIPVPEGGIRVEWNPAILAAGRNVIEYHIWRDIDTAPVGAVPPTGLNFFIDDVGPGARAVIYYLVDPASNTKSQTAATVERPLPGLAHQYCVSAVYQVEEPAGSGTFKYYETERFASGLATIVNRMTVGDLLAPAPGQSDLDPTMGIFFQFDSRRGSDTYVIQVCSSPTFAAPQYISPIIAYSPLYENVLLPFNTGDISGQLGSIPQGTLVWWRVGARNSLDQPGPLPNLGRPDQCFLFSEPSSFFLQEAPPPPP